MAGLLSMLGGWMRRVARAWVHFYYPTIEIGNSERVPQSGPVLFAANHPNSLIDPVIIGIVAKRPVRFLAKAPLFEMPVVGALMRALGMLPAFRASDDSAQVGRNTDSLAAGAELLARNEALGIFPEGKTHDAMRVEMVRSGAARIAMQVVESGVKGLQVVPLGINFERKEHFRSSVWVRVGEPIDVAEWVKQQDDPSKAARRLTMELDKRLKELVVHLEEEKFEPIVPALEVLVPPAAGAPMTVPALRQRKRIADAMNHFLREDRSNAETVAEAVTAHQTALASAGLAAHSPVMKLGGWRMLGHMVENLFWLAAFLIPAIAGTLQHLLPFLFVRVVGRKLQTPGQTTVSLARLGLGLPVYAAWYAFIAWLLIDNSFRPWVIAVGMGFMPLNGIIALEYWPRARAAAQLWWQQVRLLTQRAKLQQLRQEQAALGQRLQELGAEYARVNPRPELPPAPARRTPVIVWRVAGVTASCCFSAVLLWFLFNLRDAPLEELSGGPELHAATVQSLAPALVADEAALLDIIRGLDELEARAVALRNDFAVGKRNYYTQADNDAVRGMLLSFLNYRAALFRIIWKYQNYPQLENEALRVRAFLCNYTAAAVLHEAAMKFVTQFNRSDETVKKLNEGEPVWGIPPRLYDTVRANLASARNNQLLADGLAFYYAQKDALDRHNLTAGAPYAAFHAAIERSTETTAELAPNLWKEKSKLSLAKAGGLGKNAAYQAQSLIAIWIGDTKLRAPRKGRTLIDPRQLAELRTKLQPGDILLERRNWFLSNAFLPGYWPHAALYMGTPEELIALGLDKDPRVAPHWKEISALDEHQHRHVIVEALSEGVVFATLEHSIGGGDSVAVLRPRLSQERIKEAICRGISHAGKPYDFEFDFFSTDKIVCTELVFRSYDGDIQFGLVDVLGTKTLPAIEMVRKFNTEFGRADAQLEFIAFLDGDEKTGRCEACDVNAFMRTIKRPGMTWLQGLVADEDADGTKVDGE